MVRLSSVIGVLALLVVGSHADLGAVVQFFKEEAINAAINAVGRGVTEIINQPYMMAMRMKPHWWKKSLYCDAAVVGDRWVMTSARCCVRSCGTPYTPQQVHLRSESSAMGAGGVEHQAKNVVIMDGYQVGSMENNLCLLEVGASFSFGSKMKAVQMPVEVDLSEGSFAKISGWSNKDGTFNEALTTMDLPLISKSKCQELYAATGKPPTDITDNLFCVSTSDQDVCHGADGSPLVMHGQLVGVATAGSGCGNKPGIFTNVVKYRDWIMRHIDADEGELDIDVRAGFGTA